MKKTDNIFGWILCIGILVYAGYTQYHPPPPKQKVVVIDTIYTRHEVVVYDTIFKAVGADKRHEYLKAKIDRQILHAKPYGITKEIEANILKEIVDNK